MHLGPEAMKMIGEGTAQDIAANRRDSWFAHEIEMTSEEEGTLEASSAKDPHLEELSPTDSPMEARPTQR